MRKGVVMLMAMALIMMLSLIVIRSTSVSDGYLKSMNEALFFAQFNRSFLDITKIISAQTANIKNAYELEIALKVPLVIHDEKSDIKSILRVNSAANKFNINLLLDKNGTINKTFYDFVYDSLSQYQLNDINYFLAIVLDTIDKDDESREFQSEFTHLQNAKMLDGGIINKKAFEKVLEYYAKVTHDDKIFSIPWDEFIGFSGNDVDYNYLSKFSKELLSKFYSISVQSGKIIEDDNDLDEEQKAIFKALHVKYYVPILLCDIEFAYAKQNMNIKFKYDIKSKRVSEIESIF